MGIYIRHCDSGDINVWVIVIVGYKYMSLCDGWRYVWLIVIVGDMYD